MDAIPEYDKAVLRVVAGDDMPSYIKWGSKVAEAIDRLRHAGLVSVRHEPGLSVYRPTEAGRAILAEKEPTP
jgi:hypothetical protein